MRLTIKPFLFIPFILLLAFNACQNTEVIESKEEESKFSARVKVSAGDIIDHIEKDTLSFMAFPMNVGIANTNRGREVKVFIIGKSLRKESNIAFKPIALLKYEDEQFGENQLIIGRPIEKKWISAQVNNYFELITVYYGMQQLIEDWVRFSKGFGSVKGLQWEDEVAAELLLNS